MKIKVLHLITDLDRGGVEQWLLSMLREVPRQECEMDFMCKGAEIGELAPLARELGARIIHNPLRPTHIAFIRGLERALIEGQYHIAHSHLHIYSGLGAWTARRLDIPVISSFHTTRFYPQHQLLRLPLFSHARSLYSRISLKYALENSAFITGCSRSVLENLAPEDAALSPRFRVLYYGINIPEPPVEEDKRAFRESWGWPPDAPLVVHVGNFRDAKNHAGLIAVFERVVREIPHAKLLCVGDGNLRPMIEDRIAKAGLHDSVRLAGYRDDVQELLTRCDVFVFPSIFEGFGLAPLEANAASLPVVGSRLHGIVEAVKDGETALLHEVNDIQGMARSVTRLLKDRELCQKLGSAGRDRARESFSNKASAKNLLNLYRETLETRGS